MSAEVCERGLPYDGDCEWCSLRNQLEESKKRLADTYSLLATVRVDEDLSIIEDPQGLLSALNCSLRGEHGCLDPEEWEADRVRALETHRKHLGLVGGRL